MIFFFKIQVQNKAGEGNWSKWTDEYRTKEISKEKLEKESADFIMIPKNDKIEIILEPICPYKGN